jgi:hypothetical protein
MTHNYEDNMNQFKRAIKEAQERYGDALADR